MGTGSWIRKESSLSTSSYGEQMWGNSLTTPSPEAMYTHPTTLTHIYSVTHTHEQEKQNNLLEYIPEMAGMVVAGSAQKGRI